MIFLRHSTGIRIININDKKRHETIENADKAVENVQERSEMVMKRSGTVKNVRVGKQ